MGRLDLLGLSQELVGVELRQREIHGLTVDRIQCYIAVFNGVNKRGYVGERVSASSQEGDRTFRVSISSNFLAE